ncbi:hypothetical protein BO86DRAFT_436977 [Aspergillus japonicus CBS 114.51]|uniref:Xylanolytic transcriptional activator regulatory domain-containing protein n=1 Tax=Aspergillus japonicus CBS 114.51 TaxID=1448312 RepID=A0A8T8XEI3_ASPJA|nr:hypothetical protein BO86DRAFT_436977 [Aspergillus japonicus CBS 114.51]RAH85749.1 hypothetical protein BO86DRAFT_436977 [Aspergillus japonicus CBS 114.51]
MYNRYTFRVNNLDSNNSSTSPRLQLRNHSPGRLAKRQAQRGIEDDNFFGDSSIASFLRQIQDSAAAQSFSAAPTPKAVDLPPRELADYLLDCYYEKIHTLYPFFHRPAFARAYSALWAPGPTTDANDFGKRIGLGDPSVPWPIFHAGLNIILALGCQFSSLDRMTREATADAFFQRSQRFLNGISMDKGSLALVQTLLLMSSYLQGSESPARCWNTIGFACRMAQALGMHSLSSDRFRSTAEIQVRRRVWHGCIMLDL